MTTGRIAAYAEASGDHNPVHVDPDYAITTEFGGVVAHGMLSMAFIAELVAVNFPGAWHSGAKMKLRFRAPVFPGETVSIFGSVRSVRDDDGVVIVQCDVGCRKPDGTDALSGIVSVPVG